MMSTIAIVVVVGLIALSFQDFCLATKDIKQYFVIKKKIEPKGVPQATEMPNKPTANESSFSVGRTNDIMAHYGMSPWTKWKKYKRFESPKPIQFIVQDFLGSLLSIF